MHVRSGRSTAAAVVLVAECALVIACLTVQFPDLWAARWVQDDAYVSFRYARNLVRGYGLVYNVGQPVEGYTNFLWTLLAAIPLAAGADDPLPFMHAVSIVCWWASYGLLLGLAVGLWNAGVWAAPLGLLPLALQWSYNMWFFGGMETPLVSLLTIAAAGAATLDPRRHAWAPLAMSGCAVALMMTRPDGAVVFAALLLAVLFLDARWIVRERCWRRCVLLPALPLLVLWLPYECWRVWYYGSFFPNTYYAKVAYLTYYARGWNYLLGYVRLYGLWPFAALIVVATSIAPPGMALRFLSVASLASAGVAFYVVRLGGDFMEWRFVTPVSALFYLAAVVAANVIGEQLAVITAAAELRKAWIGCASGALAAALLAGITRAAMPVAQTTSVAEQETIGSLRRYTDPGRFDWRSAGRMCREVLPPNTRIATTSAGIIPYFCDRPCLDLHGLTDPAIAHGPVDPRVRGRVGHEHWLQDYSQIRARGVDVVVEWADPNMYPHAVAQAPQSGRELVSARLPDGRYIDFTVLNPAILPALRRNPSLVQFERGKVADRDRIYALRDRFADLREVDRLDWGGDVSEQAHHFEEHQLAESPYAHSWHTKLLRYRAPLDGSQLEDDGRRIDGWAQWQIGNVAADRDLILVGRHDHSGESSYTVEVNGRVAPDPLVTPGRPDEWWGESFVRIPKELLVNGTNTIRITRQRESERDTEWYYMWFLQDASFQPGAAGGSPAPTAAGASDS
jgi:arabinofuranosyltransferase